MGYGTNDVHEIIIIVDAHVNVQDTNEVWWRVLNGLLMLEEIL